MRVPLGLSNTSRPSLSEHQTDVLYRNLKIEIDSVVENLNDIVESLEAPVESIVHFIDTEAWDIARRNPDVEENFIKTKIKEGLEELGLAV